MIPLCKYCYIFVCVFFTVINGFNLDLQSPTVVFPRGATPGGSTSQGDLFGFSLTQHEYTDGLKTLLVGAPKASNDGLIEGGVYECRLRNGSQCNGLDQFNFRNNSYAAFNPFVGIDHLPDSSYINQLMGFTVRSSQGRVTACAPLFIESFILVGGRYRVSSTNGRCVVFPQDINSTAPLQISSINEPTFSLAGVGAQFYIPVDGQSVQLAVGAVNSGGTTTHPGGIYSFDLERSSTAYTTSFPSNPTFDELRGYHIESGHFAVDINLNKTELISSAPRANSHRGQIRALVPTSSNSRLTEVWTNQGIEADGYFGHDFALLDLQTNGYHSIVVGCPFCDRNKGSATLYLHSGDINNNPQGWFGYSVELLGDVNRDGYDDVAIGAPYINNGEGVVYIYHGSQEGLILVQTLSPARGSGMRGFGSVLASGKDIDDNGYPDLSVGDLSGLQLVTIRSSPIINVELGISEGDFKINYGMRNCHVNNVDFVCFNITPCFNLTSVYGQVPMFRFKYTLIVDRIAKRVGLSTDAQSNEVTVETTLPVGSMITCAPTYTYILQPDFSDTSPFPLELTVTDPDTLLSLSSSDDTQFGGPLHPVLNRAGLNTFQQTIYSEFITNCGADGICEPFYEMDISLSEDREVIPLAAAYLFSINISLNITEEDSLAAFLTVVMPTGIQFASAEPITELALTQCESSAAQVIRCGLKNPIIADELVQLQLSFRPDVRQIDLNQQTLSFNFTVQDSNHTQLNPLASTNFIIQTSSEASYQLRSSFGNEVVQASRRPPTVNITLEDVGPTLTYQVAVSNPTPNNRGSPIPRTHVTITWPAAVNLVSGRQPLLIPTRLTVIGSNSTTCKQRGAVEYNIVPVGIQPDLSQNVPIERCYGNNVSCGVIQCTVNHISAQSSDNTTVTTPVQISIFATLWSPSIRDDLSVRVYAKVESLTEYPKILNDSVTETQASITIQPAVREVMVDCVEPWIITVAVIAGLLAALVIVLCAVIFGFIGHGHFKRKKEEARQKHWRELQEVDGSLGARVIPPFGITPAATSTQESKDKENEAATEMQQRPPRYSDVMPPRDSDDLGPITETDLGPITDLHGFSASLGIAIGGDDELETEI